MRRFSTRWVLVLATLGLMSLAGCDNTIRGIRQDVGDTGRAVSGS